MLVVNAVKKLEKHGKVIQNGNRYHVIIGADIIEFIDQEGDVICLSIRALNNQPDAMTDYFPQTWCDNVSQALRFANV